MKCRRLLCLFFALPCFILLNVLFVSSPANAQTPPAFNPPVDKIEVKTYDNWYNEDHTTDWYQVFLDNYPEGTQKEEIKQSFDTAMEDGIWGVRQAIITRKSDDEQRKSYTFFWRETVCEPTIMFDSNNNNYVFSGCNFKYLSVSMGETNYGAYHKWTWYYNNTPNFRISQTVDSTDTLSKEQLVFFTGTYLVDSGLEIPDIPQDLEITPSNDSDFGPTFSVRVEDYDMWLRDISEEVDYKKYDINLCLFQVPNNPQGDNFSEYTYDCEEKPEVHHTFSQYATYNILHRVRSSDGIWYETTMNFKIDGSSYNTVINGKPYYEKCDLLDIMCHMRNFFKAFRNFVEWLFVPDLDKLNDEFIVLSDRFKKSMGIFFAPIDFFISTFQLFSGYMNNPTGHYCSLGSWQMFGRGGSAPIELCRWRDQLPQLWSIMQLAIQASLSIAMLYMFWAVTKKGILGQNDTSDEDDDSGDSGSDRDLVLRNDAKQYSTKESWLRGGKK